MHNIIRNILLTEGRKEDAYEKYISKAQDGSIKDRLEVAFNLFVNNDPSENHKYIDWMLKNMVAMMVERGAGYPDYHENGVIGVVTRFHQNVQRLQKKDINQYKTVKELDNALNALPETKREKKLKGADRIFEDNNLLVVVPKTQEGSCYYGANTQWCVAARNDNLFSDYRHNGILFYIIWKLVMPENMKNLQKVARYIPHGYPYETEGEYYTSTDDRVSEYSLEYDLFNITYRDSNLGYTKKIVPDNFKSYYSSWESAKIKIDTYYAKNGMNISRTKNIDNDNWNEDEFDLF